MEAPDAHQRSRADLRRTWLFGPGADAQAHEAMQRSGADVLIVDPEDFTPAARRDEARHALASLLQRWRDAGRVTAVRINALDADGPIDLAAAMPARARRDRLSHGRERCANAGAPRGDRELGAQAGHC